MIRRQFREHCFKMLFFTGFYPESEKDEQILSYFEAAEISEEDDRELKEKVYAIISRLPEIDALLSENTEGWKINRIGRVELSILRLAVYELRWDDSIPEKVAVNEAVELSKKFAGEESASFVNGVLAKLI